MIVERRCFAKINLYLKVVGRRPDGYHQLDTLFQEIDLGETLTWRVDGSPFQLVVDGADVGPVVDNLITRAVQAFGQAAGIAVTGTFSVKKEIPTGGGLGGGSSNAAHTLIMLNQHYGEPLSEETLLRLAVALGADVPFFLTGGCCHAGGVGEVLTPVAWEPPFPGGFLILPSFGVPTAPVFKALQAPPVDETKKPPVATLGENDLWPVVARLFPDLADLQQAWPRGDDEPCFMTGSGSSLVHLCHGPHLDEKRRAVLARFGARAVPFAWVFPEGWTQTLEKRGLGQRIKIL